MQFLFLELLCGLEFYQTEAQKEQIVQEIQIPLLMIIIESKIHLNENQKAKQLIELLEKIPKQNPDHLFLKSQLYLKQKYTKGIQKVYIQLEEECKTEESQQKFQDLKNDMISQNMIVFPSMLWLQFIQEVEVLSINEDYLYLSKKYGCFKYCIYPFYTLGKCIFPCCFKSQNKLGPKKMKNYNDNPEQSDEYDDEEEMSLNNENDYGNPYQY